MKNNIWIPRFTYFTTGVSVNLFVTALTLYFITIGFNPVQIGILTSIPFLASLFQPFVGLIIDRAKNKIHIYQLFTLFFLVNTIILSMSTNFYVYVVFVFLASITRLSFFGMLDSIMIPSVSNYGGNFGLIRNYASIGFGLGMVLAYPFIKDNLHNFFYVVIVFTTINIVLASLINASVDSIKQKEKPNIKKDLTTLKNNEVFILLILSNFLLFGITGIKVNYQPILLESLNASAFLISIVSFVMVIPEIIMMPKLSHIRQKYQDKTLFLYAFIMATIQLILMFLVQSPILLVILTLMHGLANGIYIPLYSQTLISKVSASVSSTALMFSLTIQFLFSAIVSFLIITPIYVNFGIRYVFLTLAIFTFMGIFVILRVFKK